MYAWAEYKYFKSEKKLRFKDKLRKLSSLSSIWSVWIHPTWDNDQLSDVARFFFLFTPFIYLYVVLNTTHVCSTFLLSPLSLRSRRSCTGADSLFLLCDTWIQKHCLVCLYFSKCGFADTPALAEYLCIKSAYFRKQHVLWNGEKNALCR